MSHKGWIALICAVMLPLCAGVAFAEDDVVATFTQPDDVVVCEAADLKYFPAPEGLQPMYDMMSRASTDYSSVYLFIMPHGRALMSLACTQMTESGSAQTLLASWDIIAQSLSKEAESIDLDPSCAAVESHYGTEVLRIRTTMALGTDGALKVDAQGDAFYRGSELMELWTVWPAEDEQTDELEQDLGTLRLLVDSLSFEKSALSE